MVGPEPDIGPGTSEGVGSPDMLPARLARQGIAKSSHSVVSLSFLLSDRIASAH
jgi:hypothetical protein